jgi:two-component system cell cycle sensor histidine kinase/response regulator CckA
MPADRGRAAEGPEPARAPAGAADAVESNSGRRGSRGRTEDAPVVLLVEDEAPVRSFASRALQLKGYTVIEAACAEDALAALADDALAVDLFVTDVMMPGMDGPTWVRRALERRPDVRTVFMSGYSKDALSDDDGMLPGSVFLPKPFSLRDFTQTIESVLA